MPSLAEIVLEGGRIRSDALRRNAEIIANQQRNSGLLWGSLISNTAQNIGQSVQHAQDVKAEQPMRDLQLQQAQQQVEMGKRQLSSDDAAQQAAKQRGQLNQIALDSWEQSDDGSWNINQDKFAQGVKAAGLPFDPTVLKPHLDALAAANKQAHDAQTGYMNKAIDVVHASGDTIDGFAQMVHGAQLNRYLREDEATGLIKHATANPADIPKMLDQLQGKQQKFGSSPQGIYNEATGQVTTPAVEKPTPPVSVATEDAYIRSKYGDKPTPQQVLKGRAEFSAAGRAPTADEQQGGPTPTLNPNAPHGDDYLKTMPDNRQQMIKSLAEGRQPFPSGMAMKTPYWQGLVNDVFQYDPTFDTATASNNARVKVRQDFTSGSSAKQVNALNTVIGHLGTLSDAAEGLGNTDTQFINTVKNWVKTQGGSSSVTNFDTAKEAVASELVRVWRQAGGSTQDVQDWKKTLDSSQSPEQLRSNIAQIGHLLESKLGSLQEQYRQGLGIAAIELLTPESRKALDKLEGKQPGQAGQPIQQRGATTPIAGGTKTATVGGVQITLTKVPDGWQAPDGSVYDATGKRIR